MVKAAIILALAILIATAASIYFSPYWSCVRAGAMEYRCAGG